MIIKVQIIVQTAAEAAHRRVVTVTFLRDDQDGPITVEWNDWFDMFKVIL